MFTSIQKAQRCWTELWAIKWPWVCIQQKIYPRHVQGLLVGVKLDDSNMKRQSLSKKIVSFFFFSAQICRISGFGCNHRLAIQNSIPWELKFMALWRHLLQAVKTFLISFCQSTEAWRNKDGLWLWLFVSSNTFKHLMCPHAQSSEIRYSYSW